MPIIPPPLRSGDTVAVVRTAGTIAPETLEPGIEVLRERGFRVMTDSGPRGGPSWLAGTDEERAKALVDAIKNPEVRAILCARGGSGSNRLFDHLPSNALADRPVWLVGASDITALHLWAQAQGVASVHGPMALRLPDHLANPDDSSVDDLLDLLAHPKAPAFTGLIGHTPGRARGPLVGGNLSLLTAMIGQPLLHRARGLAPVDLRGAVLFIEEVGEPEYRIDRMLTSLFAGARQHVAAVVIGTFERCPGGAEQVTARVTELLKGTNVPIVSGVQAGHSRPNAPFVLGLPVVVDADAGTVGPVAPSRRVGPSILRTPTTAGEVLATHLQAGTASAAQLSVMIAGEPVESFAMGRRAEPHAADVDTGPVSTRTRFDLASVTKAVCTAVLAAHTVEAGLLAMDDRCPADLSIDRPVLRDLLRHTSGLPAHIEVFRDARCARDVRATAEAAFAAVHVDEAHVGTGLYSDVGYIALGRWLARVHGTTLDALFDEYVATPIGLQRTGFGPTGPRIDREGVAATEWCPYRATFLQGTVHDENAQVLGGVCGHAGLFGTADELARIGTSLLGYGPAVLPSSAIDRMWDRTIRVDRGTYTLGWDTPSGHRSNAGRWMRRDATVGHLGFTGTSIWIDRSRDLVVALTTNRVHPTRDNQRIRHLRPAIHDAVLETWFGEEDS
jgi:muramoyltetrapeptide carboxypeptidase LdcA involved in peptidoglycan recycling